MKNVSHSSIRFLLRTAILMAVTLGTTQAQAPPIGIVDFYGLRSLSEARVREALKIKEGDLPPNSLEEIQARLEALPNVRQARVTGVCCEGGKTIIYVGIDENGVTNLKFRPAPNGRVRLPDEMMQTSHSFEDALGKAIQRGDNREDDSQGHALFNAPEARPFQEHYIEFAARNLELLRRVLRESSDAEHRALAAEIIGYASNKRAVVEDLVYGMSDPDSNVRNNSMRALSIIARFAYSHPQQHIEVPWDPFVEMLNSIEWSDRNKSSWALFNLTEKRDPRLFSRLRERAIPSLVEMSRWHSPGHAQAAFFILGRVAGLSDKEIEQAWSSGKREVLIETVTKKLSARPAGPRP